MLAPKEEAGKCGGVALLESLYKVISSIVNKRVSRPVRFHDGIHGFAKQRSCATAILETKLSMQRTGGNWKVRGLSARSRAKSSEPALSAWNKCRCGALLATVESSIQGNPEADSLWISRSPCNKGDTAF